MRGDGKARRRTLRLATFSDGVYAVIKMRIVMDTNVFVAALRSDGGASRALLRHILQGRCTPVFGNALWMEYEDLLGRSVWTTLTTPDERLEILAAIIAAGEWGPVH
jgi:predicted nucleic acid-binding protein